MRSSRSVATIVPDDVVLGRLIDALERIGLGHADLWIAARSERRLSAFKQTYPGLTVLTSAVRSEHFMAGLARAAGFDAETGADAFVRELTRAGIDEERAHYFDEELVDPKILVGFDAANESREVLQVFIDAGADLGLVNGPGFVQTLPLRKEILDVRKHVVLDAEVTVRTEIVTETRHVEVVLERHEFVIERRDFRGPGQAVEITRIPLRHEEAIFEKRVVVTAEVDVRTDQFVDTSIVAEDLSHEVLRVDDPSGVVHDELSANITASH